MIIRCFITKKKIKWFKKKKNHILLNKFIQSKFHSIIVGKLTRRLQNKIHKFILAVKFKRVLKIEKKRTAGITWTLQKSSGGIARSADKASSQVEGSRSFERRSTDGETVVSSPPAGVFTKYSRYQHKGTKKIGWSVRRSTWQLGGFSF